MASGGAEGGPTLSYDLSAIRAAADTAVENVANTPDGPLSGCEPTVVEVHKALAAMVASRSLAAVAGSASPVDEDMVRGWRDIAPTWNTRPAWSGMVMPPIVDMDASQPEHQPAELTPAIVRMYGAVAGRIVEGIKPGLGIAVEARMNNVADAVWPEAA